MSAVDELRLIDSPAGHRRRSLRVQAPLLAHQIGRDEGRTPVHVLRQGERHAPYLHERMRPVGHAGTELTELGDQRAGRLLPKVEDFLSPDGTLLLRLIERRLQVGIHQFRVPGPLVAALQGRHGFRHRHVLAQVWQRDHRRLRRVDQEVGNGAAQEVGEQQGPRRRHLLVRVLHVLHQADRLVLLDALVARKGLDRVEHFLDVVEAGRAPAVGCQEGRQYPGTVRRKAGRPLAMDQALQRGTVRGRPPVPLLEHRILADAQALREDRHRLRGNALVEPPLLLRLGARVEGHEIVAGELLAERFLRSVALGGRLEQAEELRFRLSMFVTHGFPGGRVDTVDVEVVLPETHQRRVAFPLQLVSPVEQLADLRAGIEQFVQGVVELGRLLEDSQLGTVGQRLAHLSAALHGIPDGFSRIDGPVDERNLGQHVLEGFLGLQRHVLDHPVQAAADDRLRLGGIVQHLLHRGALEERTDHVPGFGGRQFIQGRIDRVTELPVEAELGIGEVRRFRRSVDHVVQCAR